MGSPGAHSVSAPFLLRSPPAALYGKSPETRIALPGPVTRRSSTWSTRSSPVPLGKLGADVLGALYSTYVEEIDRDRLGQFYTPRAVVRFMLDRAGFDGPEQVFRIEGDRRVPRAVLDFATGSGGFLVEAARRVIDRGGLDHSDARDLDDGLAAIARGSTARRSAPFPTTSPRSTCCSRSLGCSAPGGGPSGAARRADEASPVEPLKRRWHVFQGVQTGADAYTARIQKRLSGAVRRRLEASTGDPILELPPGREHEPPWRDHPKLLARSPESRAIRYGAIDACDYASLVWIGREDEVPRAVVDELERWRPRARDPR